MCTLTCIRCGTTPEPKICHYNSKHNRIRRWVRALVAKTCRPCRQSVPVGLQFGPCRISPEHCRTVVSEDKHVKPTTSMPNFSTTASKLHVKQELDPSSRFCQRRTAKFWVGSPFPRRGSGRGVIRTMFKPAKTTSSRYNQPLCPGPSGHFRLDGAAPSPASAKMLLIMLTGRCNCQTWSQICRI